MYVTIALELIDNILTIVREMEVDMKEIIQRVKGTREFYPEDMAFRTWLYAQMRAVSE